MQKIRLREMINGRGCFVEISFSANFRKDHNTRDLMIHYYGDERWEIACKSGINLFWSYFRKTGKLEVTIEEIEWLPVDTNFLIVMYATIKALSIELDYEIPKLALDRNNGVFIFPEPRFPIL